MNYLGSLNDAQLHAATTEADVVQVLAPPGSGKTKTLTSRVAHLLQARQYKPWNVICLTFTIKSAREMGERLCRLIGEDLGKKVILGTFHSVCRRYLVNYGHLIGIQKDFGIADTSDTTAILKRIVKQLDSTWDPAKARNKISNCKSKAISPEQYLMQVTSKGNSKNSNAIDTADKHEFIVIFEEYQAHLERSNLLDYDDLLLRCVELLSRHPSCVRNVQAVLIDEFQDTNLVQFDLMRLFAQHCRCVTTVGDPDQSIYGWRSAEVANLGKMSELWPETCVVVLEQNYRSAGRILEAAQALIEQDSVRPAKELISTHRQGTKPALRRLPNPEIEAQWIVSEIKRCLTLSAGLLSYSDIAVLLRSSPLSRQIEGAFGRAGIPYRMVGGMKFFDRVEVKTLLDYMRVIAQPNNSDALSRIINVPSRKIGDTTVKGLLEEATSHRCTMWDIVCRIVRGGRRVSTKITTKQREGLSSLYNLVIRSQRLLEDKEKDRSPRDLLEFVIGRLDFKEYLTKEYKEDHETRWENVDQLLTQAGDPKFAPGATNLQDEALPELEDVKQEKPIKAIECLSGFLANVALATEIQSEQEMNNEGKPRRTVTISTMHAAKGLEWPVVFIPACYRGSIPHSRAEDTDEERRLLYVAMTRAQVLLHMSMPVKDAKKVEQTRSPFLSEGPVLGALEKSAPLLDFSVIEDMATILGRDAPSRDLIANAIKNCENVVDNKWPLSGRFGSEEGEFDSEDEFDSRETSSRWVDTGNNYGFRTAREGFKRQRISRENSENADGTVVTTMYAKTTMQRGGSFTIPVNGSGFTTAAKEMQQQREIERQTSEREALEALQAKNDPQRTKKSAKARKPERSAGQSSIMGFFTRPKSQQQLEAEVKVNPGKDNQSVTTKGPHTEISGTKELASERFSTATEIAKVSIQSIEPSSVKRAAPFPGRLEAARRPLTTQMLTEEHSSRYIFLSSSPPPDDRLVPDNVAMPVKGVQNAAVTENNTTFKNAVTVHETTIGRLSSTNSTAKRRLGMGGPMKPWKP